MHIEIILVINVTSVPWENRNICNWDVSSHCGALRIASFADAFADATSTEQRPALGNFKVEGPKQSFMGQHSGEARIFTKKIGSTDEAEALGAMVLKLFRSHYRKTFKKKFWCPYLKYPP